MPINYTRYWQVQTVLLGLVAFGFGWMIDNETNEKKLLNALKGYGLFLLKLMEKFFQSSQVEIITKSVKSKSSRRSTKINKVVQCVQ